jgi:hypothetical protein
MPEELKVVDDLQDLLEEVRVSGASLYLDTYHDSRLTLARARLMPTDLLDRVRSRTSDIADYLRDHDGVNVPPNIKPRPSSLPASIPMDCPPMSHGEMLDSTLFKAQSFHDAVLSRPPAINDPKLLYVQSRSADSVLNSAAKLQASSLAAKIDPNRAPSPRLLEAVARAEEAVKIVEQQRAARDAATLVPPDDAA